MTIPVLAKDLGGSKTGCLTGAGIAVTVSLLLWALIFACVAAVWSAAT